MSQHQENKNNQFWYTRSPVPTALGIAIQLGWLEEEFSNDPISIKSLKESDKPSELFSHFDHHLPNSFRQGGNTPAIWARAQGRETRVIGLSWTDEYQVIISLPKSGVNSIRDLRGRKVGIPKHEIATDYNRAAALRAFEVSLQYEGLNLQDIELVDLPDSAYISVNQSDNVGGFGQARHGYVNEVYALVRGEVDAIYVKDVRGAEITHLLGAQVIFDLGFHPDPYIRISNCAPRTLTVNVDTIENHPDIVTRFLRKVAEAGEWAKRHPAETISYISRETGSSEALVSKVYGPQLHQSLSVNLDEQSIKGLETAKDFLLKHGFIHYNFSVNDWIDTRPLKAVRSNVRKIA
ncbi:MAG: ABC transporter substrate-binding protein [Methylophilaceae bacterium]|jgi:ABC-type nitrate/sulfonate/bicarbonate transport system substrate-binding protein|nr:ABC transporter substrate-binding protein [Methyloradius sp.]